MKNKNMRKILGMVVLFILVLSLSACGKKENSLYHTWAGKQYSTPIKYTFYKDGSGILEVTYEDELYREKFNWEAYENGTLKIITGESLWDFDMETYTYSISTNGRTLTLDDDVILTRVK